MDGAVVQVGNDGSVVYRASALGSCTRALVAARQEYSQVEPRGKIVDTFERGRLAEIDALDWLRQHGWDVWGEQGEVVLPVTGKIVVRGHIDGLGSYSKEHGPHVVEIKSQSADEFEDWSWDKPMWQKYKWQTSVYSLSTGFPVTVLRWNRDADGIAMHTIREPFYSLDTIRARVLSVEHLATKEVSELECDRDDYPCPVFYTHKVVDVEQIDDEGFDRLAFELKRATGKATAAEANKKALRETVLAKMGEKDKVQTISGIKVSVSHYKVAERLVPSYDATKVTVTLPKVKGDEPAPDSGRLGEAQGAREGAGRDDRTSQ